jgi:hypothetical protein
MSTNLQFDQIRLPPECERLRQDVRAFLAEEIAYMRALIDVIEVDDKQIRIKGSKDVLEKAVVAGQNGQAGCSQMSTKWRAGRDSNP